MKKRKKQKKKNRTENKSKKSTTIGKKNKGGKIIWKWGIKRN